MRRLRFRRSGRMSADGCENVVPVVDRRSQSLDRGVESDHPAGCIVTGFVGIEAAVDLVASRDQSAEPARIGSRAGRGDTDAAGIECAAADGVDGRFAEDDPPRTLRGSPEVTRVPACPGRHAAPDSGAGPPQFRAHRPVRFSSRQQKDGIAAAVRIKPARFDKRLEQR